MVVGAMAGIYAVHKLKDYIAAVIALILLSLLAYGSVWLLVKIILFAITNHF